MAFIKELFKKEIVSQLIVPLAFIIISPVLIFAAGYFGGMVLNWFVGAKLVNGLNLMFSTTRFTRDMIPLACATLATIGSYFKSTGSSS